ncbi:phosphomethylpyrimidine kinase [Flavonifractor sp. An82]|nr:pyridoxamine kinase [Flavonifractor sp. An82]OUN22535.1 phosphomethylpyrimidine kinase [Flavonifractor sp. An82]
MKRIVSIQDISCVGKCSLTVALPIISAMGVECSILPTAVLSTHTMFSGFTCKDLTDQISPIAAHWQERELGFDAIYTGYLASAQQIDDVSAFFDAFRREGSLIVVDPVMADNGKLYPAFGPDFPAQMARVCAKADLILPNLTEASLLTGLPYRTEQDEDYIKEMLQALAALGPRYVALTGVSFEPGKLGVMYYDKETGVYGSYFADHLPASFHGTGDVFASTCVGGLMRGMALGDALALAADYTVESIRMTLDTPDANWYGVEFERAIPYLVRRLD